jgi:hypothetical protein
MAPSYPFAFSSIILTKMGATSVLRIFAIAFEIFETNCQYNYALSQLNEADVAVTATIADTNQLAGAIANLTTGSNTELAPMVYIDFIF